MNSSSFTKAVANELFFQSGKPVDAEKMMTMVFMVCGRCWESAAEQLFKLCGEASHRHIEHLAPFEYPKVVEGKPYFESLDDLLYQETMASSFKDGVFFKKGYSLDKEFENIKSYCTAVLNKTKSYSEEDWKWENHMFSSETETGCKTYNRGTMNPSDMYKHMKFLGGLSFHDRMKEKTRSMYGTKPVSKISKHEQYSLVLGVGVSATFEEVSAAYKKKIKVLHPDVSKKNTTEEVLIIGEAYNYFKDNNRVK